jgi:hypothetical protein
MTMSSVLEDSLFEPSTIILGVFGSNNKVSESDLQDNTLALLLQEWGRVPERVLLPTEGNSSIYLQEWAEALHIKTQLFQCDWFRNGKVAQIIRDERIQKECTHALVFLSPRSNRYDTMAEKMAKKGKVVFTSSHNQTLTQFVLSHSESSSKASTHARKSSKGTVQTLLKYQKKEQC